MTDWITLERRALKAALIAADTLAEDRVESEQNNPVSAHPLEAAQELPKVCVYTKMDEHTGGGPPTAWSTRLTLVIDCWAYGTATEELTAQEVAGDARDELVSQVLGATTGSPDWLARWQSVARVSVKRGLAAQGQLVLSAAQIEIVVETYTEHGLASRTDTDAFETSNTTVETAKDATGAPLQISVELEQDP